jgi:hypothetical protein
MDKKTIIDHLKSEMKGKWSSNDMKIKKFTFNEPKKYTCVSLNRAIDNGKLE